MYLYLRRTPWLTITGVEGGAGGEDTPLVGEGEDAGSTSGCGTACGHGIGG